jgi:hypothetical protein
MIRFTLTAVAFDLLASVVHWPLWWYTRGLAHAAGWVQRSFSYYAQSTAIGVWMKNLFVPMFGQRDWQSRIISFFMRLAMIIGKGFMLMIWGILLTLILAGYLLVLPASIIGLIAVWTV